MAAKEDIEWQKLHRQLNTTIIYVTHDQTENLFMGSDPINSRETSPICQLYINFTQAGMQTSHSGYIFVLTGRHLVYN